MATNDRHMWNGKPVAHSQHVAGIEQEAAMNEFQHGMPRQEAEHKAYANYRKQQHLESAAFHLRGLKSAQGSGDLEDAKKHGAMYFLHMAKLGFDAWKEPPPELKVHLENATKEQVHKFKAHRGDSFVLDDTKVQPSEPIAKSMHKLYKKAAAALEVLKKNQPVIVK